MHGRFDTTIPLPDAGEMEVRGPFTPDGDETEVTVHFLIVQGDEEDPTHADQTVTVSGDGKWTGGQEWTGMTSRKGRLPNGGDGWLKPGLARGIALAVAVKREELTKDEPPRFDPPAYQTLTWCSDFWLVKQAGEHHVEP